MNVARNGFAKIRFHVVRCRLNMIRFESGLHKNRIWVDSLNKAKKNRMSRFSQLSKFTEDSDE